jgi:integrase/recombinase XerD
MTTGQAVERYISSMRVQGLSKRTIERRRWSLGRFIEHCGEDLDAIDVEGVESFLGRYSDAQTRQSIRSDVNQLFRFLVQRGVVERNPCDLIRAPRIGTRAATPVPVDDVKRAIQAARPEVRLMIMFAAFAGLRVSEIAALSADDVDLDGRVIVVRRGKGDHGETVPLADELVSELRRWPARGRFFPGLQGNHVSARIRTVFRKLDIAHRPHDLRHSFGTQAARKTGGNLLIVAGLMRHRAISNTQRYVRYHAPGVEIVSGLYGAA